MSTTIEGKAAPVPFEPKDAQQVVFLQDVAVFAETERFKRLDRRHAFFKAKEYDHQEVDWFDKPADNMETISTEAVYPAGTGPAQPGEPREAREKRPTAPTRRARVTTERFTNLMFSDKRRPTVTVDEDEDTDAFLDAVRRKAKFWSKMRSARNLGGACGSVVMTVHLRNGKWSYEVTNSKFVTPLWKDPRDFTLAGVLIMYRTPREVNVKDDKGKIVGVETVDFVCRRIITENDEIVYKEMPLEAILRDPAASWIVDGDLAVNHNLGMFPGVWIQNTAESESEDGDSDCEGSYQAIDTNDRLIAQMFFGTLANCDPTVVTATDPKTVQQASAMGAPMQKGSDHMIEVGVGGSAKYMEMEGGGVETGLKLSDKLEAQIDVINGLVVPDDSTMAAAQSAEALELRYAPMLAKAGDLRDQYGEAVVELMNITAAMARAFQTTSVRLPPAADGQERIGRYEFDLPPRKLKAADGKVKSVPHQVGPGGYVTLDWGPFFAPTEQDKSAIIKNAASAAASKFVTIETAAGRVGPLYGVQDVNGEVAQARKQSDQDAEDAFGAAMSPIRAERELVDGGKPDDGMMAGGRA
jgi:hypothetical protein